MKHDYIENCGRADCDGSCNECNLAICKICGLAEGELTTDCPGEKVPRDQAEKVYACQLDFRDGRWIPGSSSPHSPNIGL